MEIQEFERIKNLIKKGEMEMAKNQGIIESIEKKWKEDNINNIEEAGEKLNAMQNDYNRIVEKRERIFTELLNSYDWDKLENDL